MELFSRTDHAMEWAGQYAHGDVCVLCLDGTELCWMDIGVGVTGAFSFSMERLPQKDKAQKCAREIAAALKKYGFDHACTQESTIIDDSHYPDTEVYLVSYGS